MNKIDRLDSLRNRKAVCAFHLRSGVTIHGKVVTIHRASQEIIIKPDPNNPKDLVLKNSNGSAEHFITWLEDIFSISLYEHHIEWDTGRK